MLLLFFVEFGQSLKDRSRECDKLSYALEKQQDSALRKLNEINEAHARERKNFQASVLQLEESEKELTINLENMQKVKCISDIKLLFQYYHFGQLDI